MREFFRVFNDPIRVRFAGDDPFLRDFGEPLKRLSETGDVVLRVLEMRLAGGRDALACQTVRVPRPGRAKYKCAAADARTGQAA